MDQPAPGRVEIERAQRVVVAVVVVATDSPVIGAPTQLRAMPAITASSQGEAVQAVRLAHRMLGEMLRSVEQPAPGLVRP